MEDYKLLVKYLERFSKKTGVHYQLNLAPASEDNSEAFKEIKEYLEDEQLKRDLSQTFKNVKDA